MTEMVGEEAIYETIIDAAASKDPLIAARARFLKEALPAFMRWSEGEKSRLMHSALAEPTPEHAGKIMRDHFTAYISGCAFLLVADGWRILQSNPDRYHQLLVRAFDVALADFIHAERTRKPRKAKKK